MAVRPTADELAFVALHRSHAAYVRERTRLDPTLEEDRGDESIYIEVDSDGSGRLMVRPEDPDERPLQVCLWLDAASGASIVDGAREALELSRMEREAERERIRQIRKRAAQQMNAAK
jgi:hypothetical protein